MPPKSVDPLHFLSAARVAIVAGKGGVGKTTVTAVLARAAVRRGLRVLVVELDDRPALRNLLGDVPSLTITAADALAEYLDTHGLKRVSRRLISSGVIDVVATAAPGIDDIVVLGKIKQLERSGEWDLILVDGPAAGHAITFLQAAPGMLATVRGGPLRTQAADVAAMLADQRRAQVVLVTLPETTPVNELVETAYALEDRAQVHLGPVVVNAVDVGFGDDLDPAVAPPESPMRAAAEFRNARRELHRGECARLGQDLALAQLHLPVHAGTTLDAAAVEQLATVWDEPQAQPDDDVATAGTIEP
ncbi:MAG: putative anion transporting ATPase [Ilumatobacteraceae bacterium]|jgi:arsenite-transporting ATPase|nr:putative anion transporting ATPase [Ilumatobacteraceae bacterium]